MNLSIKKNKTWMGASPQTARWSGIASLFITASLLGFPTVTFAQGAISEVLGDAIVECRGAIAWSDGPSAAKPRIEALQISASATDDADRIVVYAAEQDTTPEDFLTCQFGICTAHRAAETGATTSVMRLSRGLDYGAGRVQYDLEVAFNIVSFSSGSMVSETVEGQGGFICDAALPATVASGD